MLAEVETLRAAQIEIEHSQQLYAEFFELAPVGYVNLTPTGLIESANAAAAALLNRFRALIRGSRFQSFVSPSDLPKFASHLRRCRVAKAEPVTTELNVRTAGMSERYIELVSRRSTMFGSDSIIYRTVLRDVTERTMAEEALAGSEASLRAVVEQFRLVVGNVREYAIFSTDLERRVTGWYEGAERLLGYSEAEMLGQSADVIFTSEDRKAGMPELEARTALAEGRAIDDRWHRRKDGTTFWGSGIMRPMHDDTGKTPGFVKIFRDETEIRHARQEVDRSREQLWQALQQAEQARQEAEAAGQAKDRFLAVLSHELRTPLTPILVGTHMLGLDKNLPDSVRDTVEMIRRNVRLESRLVDDLLDITRISHGKLEVTREPLDFHDTIRQAIEVSRPDISCREQHLTVSLKAPRSEIEGDSARLQQVVWNLLKNASKFTACGGKIRIATRNKADRLILAVSDNGIGIGQEDVNRIFDAFEQADPLITRQYGGLGLGLAISKAIITAHQGTLRVECHGSGKGATFITELPVAMPPAPNPKGSQIVTGG